MKVLLLLSALCGDGAEAVRQVVIGMYATYIAARLHMLTAPHQGKMI